MTRPHYLDKNHCKTENYDSSNHYSFICHLKKSLNYLPVCSNSNLLVMIWFPTEGPGIDGHLAIKNLMDSLKELSSLACIFSGKLIKKKRGLKKMYTAEQVLDLESIYINREANSPWDSSLKIKKKIVHFFLVAFFFKHHVDMVEISLCHM